MRNLKFGRFAAAAAIAGGLVGVGFALPASGAVFQHGHGITISLDFSSNPNTTLLPQPPLPPLAIPSNCPFDTSGVFSITGNVVEHETSNNNGFWFGATAEGTATLTSDEGQTFVGHFTGWTGFGTNQSLTDSTGQAETGETVDFHGVNTANSSWTLAVHIDWHGTLNNSGKPTSLVETFTCS